MKRRHFLKNTAQITTGIALTTQVNGWGFKAAAHTPLANPFNNILTDTDHVLVLVTLQGGNDGLNTVIPVDTYSNLAAARPTVILPENTLLSLNGYDAVKLHPAMTGMQQLFNEGKVQIIHGVGYPDPNYSHFRSMDIWMSASDSEQVLNTGWLGRYLNYEYPNFPIGYPNDVMPHPLAIELGSAASFAFQGPASTMTYTITNPDEMYDLASGSFEPVPDTPYGDQLSHIRLIARQSREYSSIVKEAYNNTAQQLAYPDTNLAEQLRIVARLIKGGLKTRVYMVHINGFDTHDNQVVASDHTLGNHTNLLKDLSDAIFAFQNDITQLQLADRVTTMTFSEFGRRIISNFGDGTDHGAAAPLFVIGNAVNGGVLGANPTIPQGVGLDDNLPMQFDFRSIYQTMLQHWLCVPESDVPLAMLQNFPLLPIFKPGIGCVPVSVHEYNAQAGNLWIEAYPNPFVQSTTINYTSQGGHTVVQIFAGNGQILKTLVQQVQPVGNYSVTFDAEDLPAGVYYVRLQHLERQQVKPILKVKG